MEEGVTVVWLKRDLRIRDHVPLRMSVGRPTVVLYVYEPRLWARPEYDASHLDFVNMSLEALRCELEGLGMPLTLRCGAMIEVLDALDRDLQPLGGIRTIQSHQETGIGWTFGRDRAVAQWCKTRGVAWHEARQDGVFRRLGARDDWAKGFSADIKGSPLGPPHALSNAAAALPGFDHGELVDARTLGLPPSTARELQPGGEAQGLEVLRSFLRERARSYPRQMSAPTDAYTGASRLSPHLAWGTVSLRTAMHHTLAATHRAKQRGDSGLARDLESFTKRLHWRGHFIQRLESQPSMEFRALHEPCIGQVPPPLSADEEERRAQAFEAGRTGYPMVDATMRSLKAWKWTSFRMRAMLVSFASYDLWLPWRRTAQLLAPHFLDFEPGIHYSQVQMQSGITGINTLRVYNPTKQAREHDPDGTFIRTWVPELRACPDAWVHEPWACPALFRHTVAGYPAPIVDHALQSRRATAHITALRRSEAGRDSARGVHQRHGSRSFRGRRSRLR